MGFSNIFVCHYHVYATDTTLGRSLVTNSEQDQHDMMSHIFDNEQQIERPRLSSESASPTKILKKVIMTKM